METVPGTCNVFLSPHLCREWSEGKAFEFDPHNREAMASVLHDCYYRLFESVSGGGGEHHGPCLVVDVGANIGMFTGLAASLGAYVLAFEPQSDLTNALKKSVLVNKGWRKRVKVFPGFATFDGGKRNVVKKVLRTKYESSGEMEVAAGGDDTSEVKDPAAAVLGERIYQKQFSTGEQYRLGDGDNLGLFRARAENVTFRLLQDEIPQGFQSLDVEDAAGGSVGKRLNIDLVKIDTDSVDGELLRGFLHYQKNALWRVRNWIFEGTGVTPDILYDFLQENYTIYRLNMHSGFRFFNSTGHDVISNFKPLVPESGLHVWAEEVYGQRLLRNALRVKSLGRLEAEASEELLSSPPEQDFGTSSGQTASLKRIVLQKLQGASWPRRDITALTHFFVTSEEFEEPPVLRWVHTGPWWPTELPGQQNSRNRYAYPHPALWDHAVHERADACGAISAGIVKGQVARQKGCYHYSRLKRDSGFLVGDGLVVGTPVRVNGTMREHYRGMLRRRKRLRGASSSG
eukprot:g11827.t1